MLAGCIRLAAGGVLVITVVQRIRLRCTAVTTHLRTRATTVHHRTQVIMDRSIRHLMVAAATPHQFTQPAMVRMVAAVTIPAVSLPVVIRAVLGVLRIPVLARRPLEH